MSARVIFSLGLLVVLGCSTRTYNVQASGEASLPQLAVDASGRYHLPLSSVSVTPAGELHIDLAPSVSQRLTDSALIDTMEVMARWTWTEAERQRPVASLVFCCLRSDDQSIMRVFPNRHALFKHAGP